MQQKVAIYYYIEIAYIILQKKSGAALTPLFLHHACGGTFAGAWRDILFTCFFADTGTSSALAIIVFSAIRS